MGLAYAKPILSFGGKSMKLISIVLFLLVTKSVFAQTTVTYGHVVIGKQLSVAGHQLCHNGSTLFFKDLSSCEDHNFGIGVLSQLRPISCQGLILGSIKQVEKINFDGQEVVRFYNVDIVYEEIIETAYPNKSDKIIKNTTRRLKQVELCSDLGTDDVLLAMNEISERPARNEEIPFLNRLVGNGIHLINQPAGLLTDFNFIDPEVAASSNVPERFRGATVRSPQCEIQGGGDVVFKASGENSGNGIVTQASGENSGNGWSLINTDYLQSLSGQINPEFFVEESNSPICDMEI